MRDLECSKLTTETMYNGNFEVKCLANFVKYYSPPEGGDKEARDDAAELARVSVETAPPISGRSKVFTVGLHLGIRL